MCRNTITCCTDCDKFIDALPTPCMKHTTILIENESFGYCPVSNSVDAYPIDSSTGNPFNTNQTLPLGPGVYRHPLQALGVLCVWCRSKLSDETFNNCRSEFYDRCSNLSTIGFDSNGKFIRQDSNFRWEMHTFHGTNYGFWRHKDTFNVEKVASGKQRQATKMPPIELLTAEWQFPFHEATVFDGDTLLPHSVEEVWGQQLQNCPVQKKLRSIVSHQKRKRDDPEPTEMGPKNDNKLPAKARKLDKDKEPVRWSPSDEGYATSSGSLFNGALDRLVDNIGPPPANMFEPLGDIEQLPYIPSRGPGINIVEQEGEGGGPSHTAILPSHAPSTAQAITGGNDFKFGLSPVPGTATNTPLFLAQWPEIPSNLSLDDDPPRFDHSGVRNLFSQAETSLAGLHKTSDATSTPLQQTIDPALLQNRPPSNVAEEVLLNDTFLPSLDDSSLTTLDDTVLSTPNGTTLPIFGELPAFDDKMLPMPDDDKSNSPNWTTLANIDIQQTAMRNSEYGTNHKQRHDHEHRQKHTIEQATRTNSWRKMNRALGFSGKN